MRMKPINRRGDPASRKNEVAEALKEFLLGNTFSCTGGKAAAKRDAIVHHHYGLLADPNECGKIYSDLVQFSKSADSIDEYYATFIATFDAIEDMSEIEFENLLWRQLQSLHEIDVRNYGWAAGADSDPASDRFAYSLQGKSFFVVGMHPNSSRHTRRFKFPTLVINAHIQVDRLKENGTYERMKRVIRRQELALQGSINPMLAEFGELPESRQYSGRVVGQDWHCPFSPRT
jgi:FPC/CPF motif-containing protein YcgG